jgi:hypothetical protein
VLQLQPRRAIVVASVLRSVLATAVRNYGIIVGRKLAIG